MTVLFFLFLLPSFFGLFQLSSKIASGNPSATDYTLKCTSKPPAQKQSCWDQAVDEILKTQTLDQAFEFVEVLFQQENDFVTDCHHYVHKLGEKAYEMFSRNQTFTFTSKTSYCGYGFFHGFMEKLILAKTPVEQAKKFCTSLSKQTDKDPFNTLSACLHGFGHGLVEDSPHPILWGKPDLIIEPGLKLCRQIASGADELFSCSSGVFNGLESLMTNKKYNLSHDSGDPFSICKIQPDEFKRGCYTQMVVAAMVVTGSDFDKASDYIQKIPEFDYAREAMMALFMEKANNKITSDRENIQQCHRLPSKFVTACIEALAEGYLKYGPPEREYQKALALCSDDQLKTVQKTGCFDRILSILPIWYPKEKAEQICNSVDPKYRTNQCMYN